MDRENLIKKIDEWSQSNEHQKIIDAILEFPEEERDEYMLSQIAAAYNYTEQYSLALAALHSIKNGQNRNFMWHYTAGYSYFYMSDYENARSCFERSLEMQPNDYVAADCRKYLGIIAFLTNDEESFLKILKEAEADVQAQKQLPDDYIESYASELYSQEELIAVENHIRNSFGEITNMFHEIMSTDIHVDICVIPPSESRQYYTLVTIGMGAHRMNIPLELRHQKLERAELLITLPPDWQIASEEERWSWPVGILKVISHIPVESDTWLGWGHTVDNEIPFTDNSELCATMLVSPQCGVNSLNADASVCVLPNGEEVNFYHVIPLHRREMDFKKLHGAELLIEFAMKEVSHVVDISRPDTCAEWNEADEINEKQLIASSLGLSMPEDDDEYEEDDESSEKQKRYQHMIMDDAMWHLDNIREKKLPVDMLNAYTHMAFYLRWSMEHDLMAPNFIMRFGEVINEVLENGTLSLMDLRAVIKSDPALNGCMIHPYFNSRGIAFAEYYYSDNSEHSYFYDIDEFAEKYVIEKYGQEKFDSGYYQDEAYLFIPYEEESYNMLKEYIDAAYSKWLLIYGGFSEGVMN